MYNTYAYINVYEHPIYIYKVSMYPDPRVKTKFIQLIVLMGSNR